uniref:Uncharacterized protein n=1 Tax=Solanum lycopersicum TaxID=4081 RepID=A0A3Q7HY59_SOLLC
MFVQNPSPRVPLQHILLIVRSFWKLLEPFLSNVHLTLGGTRINVFKAMRIRVD